MKTGRSIQALLIGQDARCQRAKSTVTGSLKTVSDIISASFETLTRAERQLAETLLDNYPVSGLGSVTTLADSAGVSTPTVVRMVQKLGFSGFPDFQSRLHHELEETISNPIAKHDRWAADAPGTHILNRFADAILSNMRNSLANISIPDFDQAALELSNRKKPVYLAGGRITHSLADYFFTHLQVIRSGVTLISANRSTWPHYVLNMRAGDVLVLFDIRRYEQEMETMAKIAAERGVFIILFTDQWGSPIAKYAKVVFRLNIEVPSAWDSSVVTLVVVEALIEAVQSANWDSTRERMNDLETLFDTTRLFHKPMKKDKRGRQIN
jgi:DNA-binding MurR/RpiR family transcriptional regulator